MIHVLKRGKTRARFLLIVTLACLFCAGCDYIPAYVHFLSNPADRAIQEDDIRESVFRYRIGQYKDNGPFFLSIDGKDPSDVFMARFATLKKKIKKESEAYFKKEPFHGRLRDRSTDEKGISFSVGSISWMSSDLAKVRGGMYCGGLCADWGIYRLKKKDGRWVVESYEVQGVS